MKRRSAPLDDLHQEVLLILDEAGDVWWARALRHVVNAAYRVHCHWLVRLDDAVWRATTAASASGWRQR